MAEYIDPRLIEKPVYTHDLPLRIGTDCSGIEAPIQALQQLCLPFTHVSDIDKYCIQSIKANYHPERIYGNSEGKFPDGDIRNRDHTTLPDIDLYVCGFPCQPFSNAGNRQGFKDRRGNVFFSCIDVIRIKQPLYFILENVRGLLQHDKGNTWKVIWAEIESLEDIGYKVQWKVLNTKQYGIPQNRERLYVIGIKNVLYQWPSIIPMRHIKEYVDWDNDCTSEETPPHVIRHLSKVPKTSYFIDSSYPTHNYPNSDKVCSSLTTRNRMWCVPLNRCMTVLEALGLQGFDNFNIVVSKTQIMKQVGNSMSVNVVKKLLEELYK